MAQFQFNPAAVAPAQSNDALPNGWYPAKGISESEVVTTAAGGQMLKLTIDLANGRKVWPNFNIANANPDVVTRAFSDLSALCTAIGITHQINDSRELHGRPFDVKLRTEKQEGYDDRNVPAQGGYAAYGSRQDKYVQQQAQTAAPVGAFGGQPAFSNRTAQPAPYGQQFGAAPSAVQHHPAAQPQGFTPPAPIQQPVPQPPQAQAPAAPFGQPAAQPYAQPANPAGYSNPSAAPAQFQPGAAPQQFQPHPNAPQQAPWPQQAR